MGEAPQAEAAKRRSRKRIRRADVCIVGAGLAGLTAARELRNAGKRVIVLEARKRVGGRCLSRSLGPGASDVANLGATFVGPTQHRILKLMSDLGIAKFPTYSTGNLIWYENGQRKTYSGTIPPSNPVAVAEAAVKLLQIDNMAKTVPLDAPWKAAQAQEWDGMTVETWANENIVNKDTRDLVALLIQAVFSVEPRDMSMLYLLFYIHSAGATNDLIANAGAGGGQDFRVSGGTQRIAEELVKRIGKKRVLLGRRVDRIRQSDRGARVYAGGLTIKCKRVIVAIPPHLAGRIFYKPRLPYLRDHYTQRLGIGSLIKTVAVYDRPFWRDEGLNGQANSDEGPVKVVFDGSPQSGKPGVLIGFVDGEDARALASASNEVRARESLKSYVRYFGPKAGAPRMYFDHPWDREVYTGGCPVDVASPGVLTSFGHTVREPVGRIHWAGTETATVWHGYMDGAVQSGERAAREVLARL